jgi:hypothetical protein
MKLMQVDIKSTFKNYSHPSLLQQQEHHHIFVNIFFNSSFSSKNKTIIHYNNV